MKRRNVEGTMTRAKRIMIAVVSGIIAIALGLTCALCIGGGERKNAASVGSSSVRASTTYTDVATGGDYSAPGKIVKGDIFVFNYKGSTVSITLPQGEYKLELWGAAGGGADPGYGGYGAYMSATFDSSKREKGNFTLTVTVGQGGVYQNGTQSVGTRAYGGGGGGFGYGGGGGGGSFFDIGATEIMAAGGGGGAGDDCGQGVFYNGSTSYTVTQTYASGNGGYPSGTHAGVLQSGTSGATARGTPASAGSNGAGGYGGTATGPGSGNGTNASYKGGNGSGRQGGDGNKGSTNSGGGGGGGHYGGGGGGGDTAGGGGGSSYYNTAYCSGYSTSAPSDIPIKCGKIYYNATNGHSTGENGYARITVISVNQAPVQKSYSLTNQPIGTVNKPIYSYNIAQDDDCSNTTGATTNSVYFIKDTTAAGLTSLPAANTGLYLDANCSSIPASTYIDYSFTNNQTLTINKFIRQPRANSPGVSETNKLRCYVRMRDAFGGSTSHYASDIYYFDISFSNITATHQTDTSGALKNENTYIYRYGASQTKDSKLASSGQIYSPKDVGTWALCVENPIQKNTGVTVTAAELMAITAPAATNKALFRALIVPSTATSGLFEYSGDKISFPVGATTLEGYTSITITATGSSPDWQNVTFTLYMVEIDSAVGANVEPIGIVYDNRTLDVNFRVDNTRPVIRDSVSNVVELTVGNTTPINLDTYFYDLDGEITKDTHEILEVKVPDKEFVQLDKYGHVVSTNSKGGAIGSSYYNIAGGTLDNALTDGTSDVDTYFDERIAQPTITNDAFVRYEITSRVTISLTGLRPSYSLYQRTATTAYVSGTQASPVSSGSVTNPGHFYLLIHIKDYNDEDDAGIWLPIAIYVKNEGLAPVNTGSSTGSVGGQGLSSEIPEANGSVNDVFYFVPMAINIPGEAKPEKLIGTVVDGGKVVDPTKFKIQALALDGDNFTTATGLSSWNSSLNEFLTISTIPTKVSDTVRTVDYAKIEKVDVLVPQTYFNGRVRVGATAVNPSTGINTVDLEDGTGLISGDSTAYYKTAGIKITLQSATMNRYFYVDVGIKDSANRPAADSEHPEHRVCIAIKVDNKVPTIIPEEEIAAFDDRTYENTAGIVTLKYSIPMNSTFFITPYDLISDINMLDAGVEYPTGGFTLNGLKGKFSEGKFTVNGTADATKGELEVSAMYGEEYGTTTYTTALGNMLYELNRVKQTVNLVSTNRTFGANGAITANKDSVFNDKLFFARTTDTSDDAYTFNPTGNNFVYSVSNVDGYVDIYAGNSIKMTDGDADDAYDLDYLLFFAGSRTAQPAKIDLTVRDRYGATVGVKLQITIINTAPKIKKLNPVPEVAVKALTVNAEDGSVERVINTSTTFAPSDVMTDADKDTLAYVESKGIIVARGKSIAEDATVETFVNFETEHSGYKNLLYDATGNYRLTDYFLTATLDSSSAISVRAIGSTKNIEEGVYVYFFVTDNHGGTTLGYAPIEVVNVAPTFNTDEKTGFADKDRLWSVDSARQTDITRARYIVGSQVAKEALIDQEKVNDDILLKASESDIRIIATDADLLQGKKGVLLSQRGSAENKYVNYLSDYDVAVPNIADNVKFDVQAGAVSASIEYDNGTTPSTTTSSVGISVKLLFLIEGKWYERSELLTALKDGTVAHKKCFDTEGRWIVADWALRIKAATQFNAYKLKLNFLLRDDAALGGDTAGKLTAFNKDREVEAANLHETVSGMLEDTTVYMYISGLGLKTKDAYTVYGNNYVVDHVETDETTGDEITTPYLMMNDGGVKAEVYNAATVADKEGKFTYLSQINVPAVADGTDAYPSVYVPMSFFGQKQQLVSPSTVEGHVGEVYYSDMFVGYDLRDTGKENGYSLGTLADVASALTLYDGTTEWTGFEGEYAITKNPYVDIVPVDYTKEMNGADQFGSVYSLPYYNTLLTMPVSSGETYTDTNMLEGGKLLYLVDQATKLPEHNFGLSFRKKNMRTGAVNLRLTVNLVLSTFEYVKDETGTVTSKTAKTAYKEAADARSVSVSIRVDDSPIDLVADEGVLTYKDNSGSLDAGTFKNGTYGVDVSLTASQTASYALYRYGSSDRYGADSDPKTAYKKIYYNDNDYMTEQYRDRAYFSLDSINGMTASINERPSKLTADNKKFLNVSANADNRAQTSMLGYYKAGQLSDVQTGAYNANFGVYKYNQYFSITVAEMGSALKIRAVRKTYINESALKEIVTKEFAGKEITYQGFTWASGFAWDDEGGKYGGLTYAQLAAVYNSRGLNVDFTLDKDSETYASKVRDNITMKVYYPLRVLIYDDCDAGWNESSFVAMEFRISIVNTTPKLDTRQLTKVVDNELTGEYHYEKRTKLAVNSTAYFELEKYIIDPDIFTINSKLVTVSQFNSPLVTGIDRETGDYLMSPYAYAFKSYTTSDGPQGALEAGTAGLSAPGSEDADVVMYMELVKDGTTVGVDSVPSNNRLWFKVNRRTSDSEGNIRNTFEFTLRFGDNHSIIDDPETAADESDLSTMTEAIKFVIEIDNKPPELNTTVQNVTMHANDYFIMLPAYYDVFIGGENLKDVKTFKPGYALPDEGSAAYRKSKTYNSLYNKRTTNESQINDRDGNVPFYEITSAKYAKNLALDAPETAFKENTSALGGGVFMGYLGVAKDDAPWRLRFMSPSSANTFISIAQWDLTKMENDAEETGSKEYPMALMITALSACQNSNVTFEVIDGETGGSLFYTINFTIESTPPRPLNANTEGERSRLNSAHLEANINDDGTYDYNPNNQVYNTYIIPSGDADGISVDLTSVGKKTAYSEITIPINNVAVDPDNPTATLSLHGDGYFTVNGFELIPDADNRYMIPGDNANYFYITKKNSEAFTIHATGYNEKSPYETLKFRVGDPGNPIMANSIEITIRVYTVYSDMINPTVGAMENYAGSENSYLAGSNKVIVKSNDEYWGLGKYADNPDYAASYNIPTVYDYVYFGADEGNDPNNSMGTAESPIVDPDVNKSGVQSYAASVYAFIENGEPLSAERLGELLVRGRSGKNSFYLNPDKKSEAQEYIVGGYNPSGSVINANPDTLSALSKYVTFTVAKDGASISFVPSTSTLNKKIIMYVEVQKRIDTTRGITRKDNAVSAGTLFSLVVENSTPRDISPDGSEYNRAFRGHKGDSATFRVFDSEGYDALFTDSDVDDNVNIFIENDAKDSWYKDVAFKKALEEDPTLDWSVDAIAGKKRAISVSVEDGFVTITIERRMDKKDAAGNYLSEVTFPLVLIGKDTMGATCEAVIEVTVCNTPITAVDRYESYNKSGVGYTFTRAVGGRYDNEYLLRASINSDEDINVNLSDILNDGDYIKDKDNDSYVFVDATHSRGDNYEYVVDEPTPALYYYDLGSVARRVTLATLTPSVSEGKFADCFNGFTIHSERTTRNLKGTARIHILDRAGDMENEDAGIYITVEVTMLNAKPFVKPDAVKEIDILGSDISTTSTIFHLRDFVDDSNASDINDMASSVNETTHTYLRVYLVEYSDYTKINSTEAATKPGGSGSGDNTSGFVDDSSLLFSVSYSEDDTGDVYQQAFAIRPNLGYYGSGMFVITVADGDRNEYSDTETVDFSIKVNVIYNPAEIPQLEGVSTPRGKTKTITIESLMPEIKDTFGDESASRDAAASATMISRASSMFNPATEYVLVSVEPSEEASNYVELTKTENEGEWMIRAVSETATPKRVNIAYALKSDVEKAEESGEEYTKYPSYFLISITSNLRPKKIFNKMTFERYAEDGSIDPMFMLNSSNTVYLRPDQIFDDPEDDVMQFVSVKSNKASLVTAQLTDDKDQIKIKFAARGSATLTVTVRDETGTNYSYDITAANTDLPEPDLWTRFIASLESNKVMWAIIFGCILLALIILIIIIAVIKKRKRAREELEALLVSEMEIEEQMLKLSGGPSPTGYQSYGYLQSAPGQTIDPGMLLGTGMNAPNSQQLELAPPPPQDMGAPQQPMTGQTPTQNGYGATGPFNPDDNNINDL